MRMRKSRETAPGWRRTEGKVVVVEGGAVEPKKVVEQRAPMDHANPHDIRYDVVEVAGQWAAGGSGQWFN